MIEQQIWFWDVLDLQVFDLFFVVKCEDFVLFVYCSLVFVDLEILLGSGQVMLVLKIEVKMLQELSIKKIDKVFEIGIGSGYMVVLLVVCVEYVVMVECCFELVEFVK